MWGISYLTATWYDLAVSLRSSRPKSSQKRNFDAQLQSFQDLGEKAFTKVHLLSELKWMRYAVKVTQGALRILICKLVPWQ